MNLRPNSSAATPTLPDPMNGSATTSPGFELCSMSTFETFERLLGWIAAANPRRGDHVGDAESSSRRLPFSKKRISS